MFLAPVQICSVESDERNKDLCLPLFHLCLRESSGSSSFPVRKAGVNRASQPGSDRIRSVLLQIARKGERGTKGRAEQIIRLGSNFLQSATFSSFHITSFSLSLDSLHFFRSYKQLDRENPAASASIKNRAKKIPSAGISISLSLSPSTTT